MIIFHYDLLDQFLLALPRNMSSDVFLRYLEPAEAGSGIDTGNHTIMLQFMGKPDSQNVHLLVLHQCIIPLKSKQEKTEIVDKIQHAFQFSGEFHIIQGSISEIIHSV